MNKSLSPLATFHLAGKGSGNDLVDVGQLGLRPALFSAYQDLSRLRHDYPLVLANGETDGTFVRSLSSITDEILQEIAPRGIEGERLRKNVLRLEEEIRTLTFRGNTGALLQLWDLAETNLLARADETARELLNESFGHARGALRTDGEVVDCDEELPIKLLTHAWGVVQKDKARRFGDKVDELILKLSNILKVDFMRSEEAQSAETLKRSIGSGYEEVFDFEAMSRILRAAPAEGALSEKRRRRIRSALSALKSPGIFAPVGDPGEKGWCKAPQAFVFDSCSRAFEAFQDRLPEMVGLVKAMTIAELEIENRYDDTKHDSFFLRFDERFLGPDDLALFPSYLVCFRDGIDAAAEKAKVMEVLSSGLPIKVLVQSDDILSALSIGSGRLSFGVKGAQLAAMALGLNNAFVLQSSSSCLYRLRESIWSGLANDGPALFSVFSGSPGNGSGSAKNAPDVPPYLRAAAATEARAFPGFAYDPAAGSDWASRFQLRGNPQAEVDWPVCRFQYEDQDHQRITEDVAFTFVDFAACDRRHADRVAVVPRAKWHDGMVPVNEFLDLDDENAAEKVPYVLMVDEGNALHRAVVEATLIDAARRCRDMWRSLQELGGINSSHVKRVLAEQREIWNQEKERELAELRSRPEPEVEAPAPEEAVAAAQEMEQTEIVEAAEAPVDEPYIETPRCTTCNECTEINNKMFVYNDDMQAFIADPDAGTYRQLVEAAESCQVCIIHPGKPRNPNEPGLDELISRAEPFN